MRKRIVSFVLILAMIALLLPVVQAASSDINVSKYRDVESDDDYFNAVNLLSSLSIVSGYPDGSFKPDKKVTRAEMATLIISALNYTEQAEASKGYTKFNDVGKNHWATGYINEGVSWGFISGMSDTIFAPDEHVTYMQALKMLVAAIGYESYSQKDGGWTAGYKKWGNNLGIGNGVNKSDNSELTRGDVAIMLYNTIHDLMNSKNKDDFNKKLFKGISKDVIMSNESAGDFVSTMIQNLEGLDLISLVTSSAKDVGISAAEKTFTALAGIAGTALEGIFLITESGNICLEIDHYFDTLFSENSIIIQNTGEGMYTSGGGMGGRDGTSTEGSGMGGR